MLNFGREYSESVTWYTIDDAKFNGFLSSWANIGYKCTHIFSFFLINFKQNKQLYWCHVSQAIMTVMTKKGECENFLNFDFVFCCTFCTLSGAVVDFPAWIFHKCVKIKLGDSCHQVSNSFKLWQSVVCLSEKINRLYECAKDVIKVWNTINNNECTLKICNKGLFLIWKCAKCQLHFVNALVNLKYLLFGCLEKNSPCKQSTELC